MRGEILGAERRRRWSDEEKLAIVRSVGVGGATVTQIAQRHDVTRQQIYRWRYELKDVLAPALSSTNRPKSHWRGRAPQSATPAVDAFACNEARLLIALLAYEVMHIARRAMAHATGTGWSLRRLRERVLRAGARLILSGRRMTLALSSAAASFWALLWPRITTLHWAGP